MLKHFLSLRFSCFVLLALLQLWVTPVQAQEEQEPLPRERWEELREELQYEERNYKKRKEEPEEESEPEVEELPDEDIEDPSTGLFENSTIGQTILIVLGVAVLLLIIILVLRNQKRGNVKVNKKLGEAILEEIEENLEEADIPSFLDEALRAGDYQLAIRLYFLQVLQLLVQQQHIVWKKDKTNSDYVYEMQAHPLALDFREVTGIFERVWYGDFLIDKALYEQTSLYFERFMKQLQVVPEEENPPADATPETPETNEQ